MELETFIQSSTSGSEMVIGVISIDHFSDPNTLLESERKNENSSQGCYTKPCNGNVNENVEEKQCKNSSPIIVNAEVTWKVQKSDYIESMNLSDHEDFDTSLKNERGSLIGFQSWKKVTERVGAQQIVGLTI